MSIDTEQPPPRDDVIREDAGKPPDSGQPRERPVRVDRRLMRESQAARPHFVAAGGLGLVQAVVTVAQAALLARIISGVAMGHRTLGSVQTDLIWLGVVFAVRAVISGLFDFSGRIAAVRVLAELRHRLVAQLLLTRPGAQARGERTGELAASAVQGVDALEGYFAGYLPSMMLATFVPIAVLIWVVPIDWVVAMIFAITIPVLIAFMILIGVGAESRTRRRWQTLTLLSSHFLDVVRGLETLRAHRREGAQAEVIAKVGDQYRRETMGTLRLAFISSFVLELCAMIGTGLAAATIGVQLIDGDIRLYAGLTVLLLAPELYSPLRMVGQQFHASADGLAAAGRLLEVLDEPSLLATPDAVPDAARRADRSAVTHAASSATRIATGGATAAAPDPSRAELRFESVSFTYPGAATAAVHNVDLTLAPAEFLAVTGLSGAGKSTLGKLALRLADPSSGRITCDAIDLRSVAVQTWRAQCAWVPQRAQLFSATLAENIALAVPAASERQILEAARQADLAELVASLPGGLDTQIGNGGRRISAGQAQRVALARAFLSDARLVVLDEPTANLDDAAAANIAEAIVRLARGRTLMLITHDHRLATLADRAVGFTPVRPVESDNDNKSNYHYQLGPVEEGGAQAPVQGPVQGPGVGIA